MVISTATFSTYLPPQLHNIPPKPWTHNGRAAAAQRTTSTRTSRGRTRFHRTHPGELLDKSPSSDTRTTQICRLRIRIGMGLLTTFNAAFTMLLLHSSFLPHNPTQNRRNLKVHPRVLSDPQTSPLESRRLRSRLPWSTRPGKLLDKIPTSVTERRSRKIPRLRFGMGVRALMISAKSCCHRNTETIRRPPCKRRQYLQRRSSPALSAGVILDSPPPTRALATWASCRWARKKTRVISKSTMIRLTFIPRTSKVIFFTRRSWNLMTRGLSINIHRPRICRHSHSTLLRNPLCPLSSTLIWLLQMTTSLHQLLRVAPRTAALFEPDELPHVTTQFIHTRIHFPPLFPSRTTRAINAGRVNGMAAPPLSLLLKSSKTTFFAPRKTTNTPSRSTNSPEAIARQWVVAGAIAPPI